jgi:DNA-binding transcriptional LysR family regulator
MGEFPQFRREFGDALMPPPVPVHLLYAESRLLAPKLRAFIDFAPPRIGRALAGISRDLPSGEA